MAEGLVDGTAFAVDASLIAADAKSRPTTPVASDRTLNNLDYAMGQTR
jgi:hypothetical protein